MTRVRVTSFKELKEIYEMSTQRHASEFLSNKLLETHEHDFKSGGVTYLSIISSCGLLAGYIILCKEEKARTAQLKRILIN